MRLPTSILQCCAFDCGLADGRELRSDHGLPAACKSKYRTLISYACVSGLIVDRRELKSDLGLDVVGTSGYRPSILEGCALDRLLVESRELGSDLRIDSVRRSGSQFDLARAIRWLDGRLPP